MYFVIMKKSILICLEKLCSQSRAEWATDMLAKPKLLTFRRTQYEYGIENDIIYIYIKSENLTA